MVVPSFLSSAILSVSPIAGSVRGAVVVSPFVRHVTMCVVRPMCLACPFLLVEIMFLDVFPDGGCEIRRQVSPACDSVADIRRGEVPHWEVLCGEPCSDESWCQRVVESDDCRVADPFVSGSWIDEEFEVSDEASRLSPVLEVFQAVASHKELEFVVWESLLEHHHGVVCV